MHLRYFACTSQDVPTHPETAATEQEQNQNQNQYIDTELQPPSSEVLRPHLLEPDATLKQRTINGRRHSQGTTDDGAQASDEAKERLGLLLPVDDFHGRDVLDMTSQHKRREKKPLRDQSEYRRKGLT